MPQGEAKGSITADKSNAWEERGKRIGHALACGDMPRHKGAISLSFDEPRPRCRLVDFSNRCARNPQLVAQFLKLRDWLFAPLGLFDSWPALEELKALMRQPQNLVEPECRSRSSRESLKRDSDGRSAGLGCDRDSSGARVSGLPGD